MQRLLASATFLFSLNACQSGAVAENSFAQQTPFQTAGPQIETGAEVASGKTVSDRFLPPTGFSKIAPPKASFAYFLSQVSCKPAGTPVLLFNGEQKTNQRGVAAVLDLDASKTDLQQCADAVMRLRAEYLFAQGRLADIHFNFTNGFRADFSRWAAGERIVVSGNNVSWRLGATPDDSYQSLRQYLEKVFTYAGTLSLQKELKPVSITDIQAGDVFIQGGSPGHAMIVMEVARNTDGQKAFMLAQSYMPAQDIHIVVNLENSNRSPWFFAGNAATEIKTPDWTFLPEALRRFKGD